jgi:hypothetical protein
LAPHLDPEAPEAPASLSALRRLWEHPGETRLDLWNSRLLLYVPADREPWREMCGWNRVLPLRADPGLARLPLDLAAALPDLQGEV